MRENAALEREAVVRFRRDPLLFLDQEFAATGDAFWLPGRQLCVAEPETARAILGNAEGLYREHSDFFSTRQGMFGPRAAQVEIGRAARALLTPYLGARTGDLAGSIRRQLVSSSEWPDAGNWLVYRHFAAALAAGDGADRVHQLLEKIIERAVLAGARQRYSRLTRAIFRRRVKRGLRRAIDRRRAAVGDPPADLLDVVAGEAGRHARPAELVEVYLSFLFAIAGSVGFTLGWSLYLLGTHPPTEAEPGWIVREALRLWPIAWMLGRPPARDHEVLGHRVTPRDLVVVSPYLVHRHPRHWNEPANFKPQRWAASRHQEAFIPFGWGPHTCVATSLTFELVEEVLRIILDNYRLIVEKRTTRLCFGPALAPPRFALRLVPRSDKPRERR